MAIHITFIDDEIKLAKNKPVIYEPQKAIWSVCEIAPGLIVTGFFDADYLKIH